MIRCVTFSGYVRRALLERYCQMLWAGISERPLDRPFSGACQNTNPVEIVRCRATTEAVFPPFPNGRQFVLQRQSCQAAS